MLSDRVFSGSIPTIYDRCLGPLIFAGYADDLARRAAAAAPARILETAAGTGVLTRALAQAVPTADITATDLNQPMLDFASGQPGGERIRWAQADAQKLQFDDASFDVVACQFGAMFFPDKLVAYREASRVLKPGGRFLFNVWDDIVDNEFADVVTATVAALFPADPPNFLARTPHGYHDARAIEAALRAAGFRQIEHERVALRSRAASAHDAAYAYCAGTPLRNEIETRDPSRLSEATDAAARALAERFGNGAIEGKIQALIFTAS